MNSRQFDLSLDPTLGAQTEKKSTATTLAEGLEKTFIIAYKEPTEVLESALKQSGLECEVLRQQHQPEYKDYSPSYLCLLNHRRGWEIAMNQSKPTLIVEADFVPVLEMGQLPLPFNPMQENVGISWLYTCAPQIYSVSPEGYAEGFSTAMVAYIVTPAAAKCLLELEAEIRENPGPKAYSSWDSTIDKFLRERKFQNYVPFRNYGEHGGKPNLEHYKHGLSKTHRADVLYGKLAFMPLYVEVEKNHQLQLLSARLQARLKGMARLAVGKYLRLPILQNSSSPQRLLRFAISRQFTFRL
ncbi:MAG: LPS biosynthesis glycosyltransferase [Cyanobacteria bacterium J06592_8]